MIFSGFFRSILSGEGDMKFPMMVAGLGTILNIILDPIFIFDLESLGGFGFGLGIAGAAMATVISQVVVFIVFIFMLFFKNHSYISFNLSDFTFSTDIIWDIIKVGLPASLSMIVMAVGQGVFNKILVHISVNTVAAYQVAGRLDMLVFLPIFSIAASLTHNYRLLLLGCDVPRLVRTHQKKRYEHVCTGLAFEPPERLSLH